MDQLAYMPYVVAIVGIAVVFGLPIVTWIFFRLLAHRERMEMIRHGYAPGSPTLAGPYVQEPEAFAGSQLRRGVSVSFIGLALVIGLSFIGFRDGEFVFGPWLLGGLIPLFVGLAQVVNALINGARFGAPFHGSPRGPVRSESAQPPYEMWQSEQEKRPPV